MSVASSTLRAGPVSRGSARRRRHLVVLAFMAPWMLGFTIFFVYPLLATGYFSLTKFDLINPPVWNGVANYVFMFTADPLMWQSVGNTLWLTVVLTVGNVVFALVTALVLSKLKRGGGVLRTLFYLPALVPPVAAALVFVFIFNPATGVVNTVLSWFGVNGPLWFNDPAWAKPGLAAMSLWGVGNLMVIMLAALLDVPRELYEAASVDGAGPVRQFRAITLPSLAPVLLFAVVNSVIGGMQYFTEALVAGSIASGSPEAAGSSALIGYPENSTLTFPMWLFQQGFRYYHMGYAAAMAVVLFIVSVVIAIFLVQQMRKAGITEEGEE